MGKMNRDHNAFLDKAKKREGLIKTFEDLEEEYALAKEKLAARARVGLSQEAVAEIKFVPEHAQQGSENGPT